MHKSQKREKIFNFFPTFEIIASDSVTKLARAEMNFWGTKFYLYDPRTNQEMAVMSRPFFRIKNDWTIEVTNRSLIDQKNMDPRLLMTVLAVQGEIEDWIEDSKEDDKNQSYSELREQLSSVPMNLALDKVSSPSDNSLERLADKLEQGFKTEYSSLEALSNKEKVHAFMNYCLKLVHEEQSEAKKKAIITLLNLRLQGHY